MSRGFKRLVSMLLAAVMLIGLVPVSDVKTVKAELTQEKTIYVSISGNSGYKENAGENNVICKYFYNSGDGYGTMKKEGDGIYSYNVPGGAVQIQFFYSTNDGSWMGQTKACDVDDRHNYYYIGDYYWEEEACWDAGQQSSNYTPFIPTPTPVPGESLGTSNIKVKFYDYLSDEEGAGQSLDGWNQFPDNTVSRSSRTPFTELFEKIAELAQNKNMNFPTTWTRPLYTGNFWMGAGHIADGDPWPMWDYVKAHTGLGQTVDNPTLDRVFNQLVNNNVGLANLNQVVQGLVEPTLSGNQKDGELLAANATNNLILPHFNDKFLSENKLAKIIETEFPMVIRKTPAGNIKYSFDSTAGTDNVYYDETTNKMVYGAGADNAILDASYNYSEGETNNSFGFFPFDKPRSEGGDGEAKNFGYGARFDIDFNLPSGGVKNGEDVTFSFSGDDDLWVFVDGKLILDMGGIHGAASGNINFRDRKSTITEEPAVVNGDGSLGTGNRVYDFSGIFDNNDADAIHHMTIFYMERGLVASNLHIEYTFDPIPSGLSLNKEVDVQDVNPGLQAAAKSRDKFDFLIEEKKPVFSEGKTRAAEFADDYSRALFSYTKVNDEGTPSPSQMTVDGEVKALGDSEYARDFAYQDISGAEGLVIGTPFRITEQSDTSRYATTSIITNLSDGDKISKDGVSTEFVLGELTEDKFAKADYNVKFINKVLVGSVTVTKAWAGGNVPAELENAEFDFKVEVDLDGDKADYDYAVYELTYTSSEAGRNGITGADGGLKIKANETVSFAGIPVGAKVRITEATTSGDTWTVDGEASKEVTVAANSSVNATIINKSNEIIHNKVIYAEAGRSASYEVKDGEDVVKVDNTTATAGITTDIRNGVLNFIPSEADKKYDVPYTGTKKDNTKVKGTITVYSYAATKKVYVFDYGLKSDLAEINEDHDGLFQDGVFFNKEAQNTTDYKTSATLGAISDNGETTQTDITADPDGVTIKADGSAAGSVMFEPKGFMSQVENYKYTANIAKANTVFDAGNPETGTVVNGTIQVMPASVVYYEDNFNAGTNTDDSSMKILYTGNNTTAGTSLDLVQSNGQTEQYGHDDAYNTTENQQDSGGSSTMLTANGYSTKAIFTFTGTGFDILARTTTETAGIVYTIEKYDQTADKYSLFRMGAVDTLYTNGALYQLPVIHEDLDHGTYRVTLGIKQTGNVLTTKDENGNIIKEEDTRKYVVYLDGIRIYNPLGEKGNSEYLAEEQEVTVSEIPGLIVGNGMITEKGIVDEDGDTIINSQVIDGASAVIASYSNEMGIGPALEALGTTQVEVSTGDSSDSKDSVLTYMNAGPNNELYLDETAALAFVVKATDPVNTLQIEAKLVDTQSSGGSKSSAGLALRVLSSTDNGIEEKTIDTIKSSTAMYYRIPVEDCISLDNGYYLVVILGNSDSQGGAKDTHTLSFSNLKCNNYTVESPYTTSADNVGDYLEFAEDEGEPNAFVSVNLATGLKKNTWQSYNKHSVTLTRDVFNGAEPEFTMYYVNAAGVKVTLAVTAQRSKDDDRTYQLRFKTPNAKGNFPVEIHYFIDSDGDGNAEESADYISTVIKVTK